MSIEPKNFNENVFFEGLYFDFRSISGILIRKKDVKKKVAIVSMTILMKA